MLVVFVIGKLASCRFSFSFSMFEVTVLPLDKVQESTAEAMVVDDNS